MTVAEIVEQAVASGVSHAVLTGGEPMLFDATEELCRQLRQRGFHITIETAGTIFRELECDLMSISPKLSNSTPGEQAGKGWTERHEVTRRNLQPLKQLVDRFAHQLKFVVNPDIGMQDLDEIEEILAQLPAESRKSTLLMPEGTDSQTLARRGQILAQICIEKGFRLSPRLHVDLWGNRRGV